MPVCVFVVPAVCAERGFCVLLTEAAAGFAAGFAAGVELSVAAGVVDGLVAGVCWAAAEPAKIIVTANTPDAMLDSFRMDLVSHWFVGRANVVIRDWCVLIRDSVGGIVRLPRSSAAARSQIHQRCQAQDQHQQLPGSMNMNRPQQIQKRGDEDPSLQKAKGGAPAPSDWKKSQVMGTRAIAGRHDGAQAFSAPESRPSTSADHSASRVGRRKLRPARWYQ